VLKEHSGIARWLPSYGRRAEGTKQADSLNIWLKTCELSAPVPIGHGCSVPPEWLR